MIVVYTLATGRSGTTFLTGLFAANVHNCVALHERLPFMNGRVIDWHDEGREDLIEREFEPKRRLIESLAAAAVPVYLDCTHLFLKSFCEVAIRHNPEAKLVWLIRDPVAVARSHVGTGYTVNKENPYCCRPSLPIFCGLSLTPFQQFLVQWIEIHNRAAAFVERHDKQGDAFPLISPDGLNDPDSVFRMFAYLGIKTHSQTPIISGEHNASPSRPGAVDTEQETAQFQNVIDKLDAKYLSIFHRPPFTAIGTRWAEMLRSKEHTQA